MVVMDEVITDLSPDNPGQLFKSITSTLLHFMSFFNWVLLLIFTFLFLASLYSSWDTAVCKRGSVFKIHISVEGEQHHRHQCDPPHWKHLAPSWR